MHAGVSEEQGAREDLVGVARALQERGLNHGTSGNCSARCAGAPGRFLVTPSAVPVDRLVAAGMVLMALTGEPLGAGRPSSEWRFHRDIYRARPEVGAIVHVHSPAATALACLRRDLPAFHYMVALAGGDSVRCAAYALYGTQALSDAALLALAGRSACLLANHGMIATGATPAAALSMAVEVEALCEQYLRALAVGEPVLLSAAEMAEAIEQFKDYRPAAA